MKSVRTDRPASKTTPIRISLTEAEILEDLRYPVPVERIERQPAGNPEDPRR